MEPLSKNIHTELLEDVTCMKLSGACNLVSIRTANELNNLPEILRTYPDIFIIGSGSNIVCNPKSAHQKMFLRLETTNVSKIEEDDTSAQLKIDGGYSWDALVEYAVEHNYAGIENLSAIPGTVGAAPVQNIGAYGSELKDVFISCTVLDRRHFTWKTLSKADCNFGYRSSIFNTTDKNRYIITDITIRLSKKYVPSQNPYPAVREYFQKNLVVHPTLQQVRDAITTIRWSKLPKPENLGNCGSFFKNITVPESTYNKLRVRFPSLSGNQLENGNWKLASGQLIDLAGLKGTKDASGHFGMYEKNALVLVHFGDGTYDELFKYVHTIQEKIYTLFGVHLEVEPTLVD